jgi:hypothetical protein
MESPEVVVHFPYAAHKGVLTMPTVAPGTKSATFDFRKSLVWEWGSLWRECGFGK